MIDPPLRLGLIGAGRWGRIFIKTLSRLDGFDLARLASSNPDSSSLVGENCSVTDNWRTVAGAGDLDGVIIATPPAMHEEMTRFTVGNGTPVLVEKPLTLDSTEAYALLDFARQNDAIVHDDHIHLYHPAYRELKNIGSLMGPIHSIQSSAGDWGPFRTDTPLLWDRGPHDIAMCLDLMKKTPEIVHAQHNMTQGEEECPGEAIAIRLIFPDDVTAKIELSNLLVPKKRSLSVHYVHETLTYDDVGPNILIRKPRLHCARSCDRAIEPGDIPNILPLDQVLIDFALAIEKGESDLAGLRLGVETVDILSACERSLQTS